MTAESTAAVSRGDVTDAVAIVALCAIAIVAMVRGSEGIATGALALIAQVASLRRALQINPVSQSVKPSSGTGVLLFPLVLMLASVTRWRVG